MGRMEDSNVIVWAVIGLIVGTLASLFVPFVYVNIWPIIAIVALVGGIAIFVGKIVELDWIDVGLPSGAILGLLIGYLVRAFVL